MASEQCERGGSSVASLMFCGSQKHLYSSPESPRGNQSYAKKHPAVADATAIGFKSKEWGEAVKAFVVLNPNADAKADALIQFCKDSLASYKAPKAVEFVSELPRTALGKIDRGRLG